MNSTKPLDYTLTPTALFQTKFASHAKALGRSRSPYFSCRLKILSHKTVTPFTRLISLDSLVRLNTLIMMDAGTHGNRTWIEAATVWHSGHVEFSDCWDGGHWGVGLWLQRFDGDCGSGWGSRCMGDRGFEAFKDWRLALKCFGSGITSEQQVCSSGIQHNWSQCFFQREGLQKCRTLNTRLPKHFSHTTTNPKS